MNWNSESVATVHRLLAAAAVILCVACGPERDVRDAENEVSEWRLSPNPELVTGRVDGDDRYLFGTVAAAWVRSDGGIVVVDAGRPGIILYDSAGTYVSEGGRRGRGPGEMQTPLLAWEYRGDSIAIYDLELRRVSIFGPDLRPGRDFLNPVTYSSSRDSASLNSPCCIVLGSLADGSFVVQRVNKVGRGVEHDRFSVANLLTIAPDGSEVRELGDFPWQLVRNDPTVRSGVRPYHGSTGYLTAGGNEIVLGHSLDSLLTIVGSDGATSRVRLPGTTMPYSPELRAQYEEAFRNELATPGGRGYHGTIESNLPDAYPPTAPRYLSAMVSAEGDYWLKRWTPRYGRMGGPQPFDILAGDGRHLANITLDHQSRLLWASREHVLLVEPDEFGVQFLKLYTITGR
jgi:hypothetical protein